MRIFGDNFFYSNLRIQEGLTGIRYGIEARRGLIIITGGAGGGKTTLLSRAVAEMPPHIFCVAMSGKALQLRDVLRQLNATESVDDDEAALVRGCQSLLRSRLGRNELTALAIDDAHCLPERTLRGLIHNFLGGSAESPDGALLQLILAGNAQLKYKLSQAALIPLRRRRPVICEVAPLTSQEVGTYIQEGLRSADRPIETFDNRAVKRIALLTQGNPRTIERLCECALRLIGGNGLVTAETIDAAAQALNLRAGAGEESAAPLHGDFASFLESESPAPSKIDASRLPQAGEFFEVRRPRKILDWFPRGPRVTAWLRALTFLTLTMAAAALIPAQPAIDLLRGWGEDLGRLARSYRTDNGALGSAGSVEPASREFPHAEPPQPQPSSVVTIPGPDSPGEPKATDRAGPGGPSPHWQPEQKRPAESAERKAAQETPRQSNSPRSAAKEAPNSNRELQLEVTKAIESRAIMGVEVSVVQGTAILDGRVATERQRRAAERAALSVTGVERVRNRIAITAG